MNRSSTARLASVCVCVSGVCVLSAYLLLCEHVWWGGLVSSMYCGSGRALRMKNQFPPGDNPPVPLFLVPAVGL